MATTPLNPSPSRTYVLQVYEGSNYESVSYRQFTLPKHIDNTCAAATHYFYQQDLYSCGQSAYPIEMHNNIKPLSPGFNFKQ